MLLAINLQGDDYTQCGILVSSIRWSFLMLFGHNSAPCIPFATILGQILCTGLCELSERTKTHKPVDEPWAIENMLS